MIDYDSLYFLFSRFFFFFFLRRLYDKNEDFLLIHKCIMHVLRKLTRCLSSTTCNNDESPQQEEQFSSTTNILPSLSLEEDITIKSTGYTEVVSTHHHSDDIQQIIPMDRR